MKLFESMAPIENPHRIHSDYCSSPTTREVSYYSTRPIERSVVFIHQECAPGPMRGAAPAQRGADGLADATRGWRGGLARRSTLFFGPCPAAVTQRCPPIRRSGRLASLDREAISNIQYKCVSNCAFVSRCPESDRADMILRIRDDGAIGRGISV